MADMTLLELSDLVCKWENILAAIVVIILGILAGIGKNKNVRLLGFAVTAASMCALLSQTGMILQTLIDNGSHRLHRIHHAPDLRDGAFGL